MPGVRGGKYRAFVRNRTIYKFALYFDVAKNTQGLIKNSYLMNFQLDHAFSSSIRFFSFCIPRINAGFDTNSRPILTCNTVLIKRCQATDRTRGKSFPRLSSCRCASCSHAYPHIHLYVYFFTVLCTSRFFYGFQLNFIPIAIYYIFSKSYFYKSVEKKLILSFSQLS